MKSYTIQIARRARKALGAIEPRHRRRIEDVIEALAGEPRPHGV